jgi:hypothetical protein
MDHLLSSAVAVSDLVRNCAKNRQEASKRFGECLRNFAFPQGDVTVRAKRALARQYDTCRTIEPGINRNPFDFGFLRANSVYSQRGTGSLKRAILENSRNPGWLILYTHDISPAPSRYGCSPEDFREVLDCAIASQAQIVRVTDAVTLLRKLASERPHAVG